MKSKPASPMNCPLVACLLALALAIASPIMAEGETETEAASGETIPVFNPSFEDLQDGVLDGWSLQTDPAEAQRSEGRATVAELKQDTEVAREGSASALIIHEGPRWATIRQSVDLIPGASYRLTAYVRTDTDPGVGIRGSVRLGSGRQEEKLVTSPSGGQPVDINSHGEWIKISREYKVSEALPPKKNSWIELRAIINNKNADPVKVWFDDVSLEILP
jgi:hypothetical protein